MTINLDRNEFGFSHLPELNSRISVDEVRYYDATISNDDVIRKLSEMLGCDSNKILLTAGGIGAIELLFDVYVRNNTLLTTVPTYSGIRKNTQRVNANIIEINTYLDSKCHTDIFCNHRPLLPLKIAVSMKNRKTVCKEKQITYICTPNNPTGMIWDTNDIHRYASATSNMVLIDEVYVDFTEADTCISLLDLKNVAIIRSFSKSYGLAGVRFGYILAHETVIQQLLPYYEPMHVTNIAKKYACGIIDHITIYQYKIHSCVTSRDCFMERLKHEGYIAINTPTNFVLLYIGKSCSEFIKCLKDDNILVRDITDYGLPGFIRISIVDYDTMINVVFKSITNNSHLISLDPPLVMFYTPCIVIKRLLTLLRLTSVIFQNNKIAYWLADGTLLSTIRHNGTFMKWDVDIDIGVIEDVGRLAFIFKKQGLSLVRNRLDTYWQIRFTEDICDPLSIFYKSSNYHLPYIDIFMYDAVIHKDKKIWKSCDNRYVNLGDRSDEENNHGRCDLIYYDNLLFPLLPSIFEGINVFVPNQSEKILSVSLSDSYKDNIIIEKNGKLYHFNIGEAQ